MWFFGRDNVWLIPLWLYVPVLMEANGKIWFTNSSLCVTKTTLFFSARTPINGKFFTNFTSWWRSKFWMAWLFAPCLKIKLNFYMRTHTIQNCKVSVRQDTVRGQFFRKWTLTFWDNGLWSPRHFANHNGFTCIHNLNRKRKNPKRSSHSFTM